MLTIAFFVVATTAAVAPGAPAVTTMVTSPRRVQPPSRQQLLAATGGVAGLAIGWATTPTQTEPIGGGVRTAEAWRRKIMSRRPVPLINRAPRICATSLACFTLAEYALAFPTHGPVDSLAQLQIARLGQRAAVRMGALAQRLRPTAARILGARERLMLRFR